MMPVGEGWELPQGLQTWSSFHWFRISPRRPLAVVVLSQQPTWYSGHFDGGRMRPCQAPHCASCDDGVGRQVRYVFAVAEIETKRVGLLEVSQSVAEQIRAWTHECEGLRGMCLEFAKHSHSVRSRTEVELLRDASALWYTEVDVPDPGVALRLTWQKVESRKVPSATKRVPSW